MNDVNDLIESYKKAIDNVPLIDNKKSTAYLFSFNGLNVNAGNVKITMANGTSQVYAFQIIPASPPDLVIGNKHYTISNFIWNVGLKIDLNNGEIILVS